MEVFSNMKASNTRMTVDDASERIWEEVAVTYFKVGLSSQNFPIETEGNNGKIYEDGWQPAPGEGREHSGYGIIILTTTQRCSQMWFS
jgi:hypothetical protein